MACLGMLWNYQVNLWKTGAGKKRLWRLFQDITKQASRCQKKTHAIVKSENFQAAMFILRQLEFGIFDFRLHHTFDAEKPIKFWIHLNQ